MAANAQTEKEKGNAAFRAEKYPEAVGHYSAAIFADASDPTLPLNRAAAYLKLGKNVDAERDCSAALRLKPGHVKALYRRAQARIELQKRAEARKDLLDALKIEPSNAAVKAELQKLDTTESSALEREEKGSANTDDAPHPRRRRVPIEIVDTPRPAETDALKPVSTRSLSSQKHETAFPTSAFSSTSPPSTSVRKKETPPPRPERQLPPTIASSASLGGGIFRPSGTHTLFRQGSSSSPKSGTSAPGTNSVLSKPETPQSPPTSLFDFLRSWELASIQARWELLCRVPPESLPALFKTSLEAPILTQIVEVLWSVYENGDDEAKQLIQEYLRWFPRVPRFDTVTLFLSKGEKAQIKALLEAVGAEAWRI